MPAGWKATSTYATDLNSLTIPDVYSCNASTSNTPSGITSGGLCITYNHAAAGNLVQEYITMTTTAAQANLRFFRMWNGSAWSSWEESATVSKSLQLAGGTMTGAIVMGGSAGSDISNFNVMSWISTAAARASMAAAGFSGSSASGNGYFDVVSASRIFRVMYRTAVITRNSSGEATVPYPAAFPTAVCAVIPCLGDNTGATSVAGINFAQNRTGNFVIHVWNQTSSACRINFIAIGY